MVVRFYRFFFATILLVIVILFCRESFALPKRQIMFAGLPGFFLAMAIVSWDTSIRQINMGIAILLDGLQVFFLVGFFVILQRKTRRQANTQPIIGCLRRGAVMLS